jgi:hypothetical protein
LLLDLSEEQKKKMTKRQLEEWLTEKKAMAEEAKFINLSLGAIRSVVTALVGSMADVKAKEKADSKATPTSKGARSPSTGRHIPYKENKLTELMQDSLGGGAKTLMFVNVRADSDYRNDTARSLEWATLIRKVTNDTGAKVDHAVYQALFDEHESLKAELEELKKGK